MNEFEPASTDVGTDRMKTPFEFVIKAMAVFNSVSSPSYHEVSLKFNDFYTYVSSQRTDDLNFYIPTCHLNGVRIHYCVISSGYITTRFTQAFSLGQ